MIASKYYIHKSYTRDCLNVDERIKIFLRKKELRWQLGEEALTASRLVTFASWLRGQELRSGRLLG